jgi:hypothetical protein
LKASTILLYLFLIFSIIHGLDFIFSAIHGLAVPLKSSLEYITEGVFFIVFPIAMMFRQRWGYYGFIAAHIAIIFIMVFIDNLGCLIWLYLISLAVLIILTNLAKKQLGFVK